MNPTVRAVSNPIAVRGKVDLIAFIRVPDSFAAPIHCLCVSRAKEGLRIALGSFLVGLIPRSL
jgi:hypothetical protein